MIALDFKVQHEYNKTYNMDTNNSKDKDNGYFLRFLERNAPG